MMQLQTESSVITAVTLVFGLLAAAGCGNELGEDNVAQLNLEEPGDKAVALRLPEAEQQQGPNATIRLQSNGKKPLEVETATLVEAPDRLLHRGLEELGECNYDDSNPPRNGDCDDGQYCDDVTSTCRPANVPETPITVAQGESTEFNFFLAADSEAETLECPEPGDDVPDNVAEAYCGEFRLETNASTDNAVFEDGDATFYFQTDASRSGRIVVSPASLDFNDLEPGVSVDNEFSIENDGEDMLTLDNLEIDRQPSLIELEPSNTPLTIEAGRSENFTVTVDIPSGYDMDDLQTTDFINIKSSAINESQTGETVTLNLSASSGFGPGLQFDKPAFSFSEGKTDTVTVENIGKKTLDLQQASFQPSDLDDVYEVTFNGEQGNNLGNAEGIPPGETAELELEYTGDGDDTGRLIIDHNDETLFEQSSLMLLADQDGAVGDVVPDNVNFEFQQEESSRRVLLHNRGSDTLTIGKEWTPDSPSEISIDQLADGDTLAPGEIAAGEVKFLGGDGDQPKLPLLNFAPDSIDIAPGLNGELNVNIKDDNSADRSATITSNAEGDSVDVGEVARLEFQDDDGVFGGDDTLTWTVLDRPDGSNFYSTHEGDRDEPFFVRPDTAGTYEIGGVVFGGGKEIQATYTLEATAN